MRFVRQPYHHLNSLRVVTTKREARCYWCQRIIPAGAIRIRRYAITAFGLSYDCACIECAAMLIAENDKAIKQARSDLRYQKKQLAKADREAEAKKLLNREIVSKI